jgi:O-antigen ligase
MDQSEKFGIAAKCGLILGIPVFFLVFPVSVALSGSMDLLNWGPCILVTGLAGLLLVLGNGRKGNFATDIHGWLWFGLLAFLLWRASGSSESSLPSIISDASLMVLGGIAYAIGKSSGVRLSCALMVGLAATVFLNLGCMIMQLSDPEWNLIYPQRSGGFPAGLFAHYNCTASFCLGALGIFVARSRNDSGFMKWLMIVSAVAAAASVPLTLSRGGSLGLAVVVVVALVLLIARGFRGSKGLLNVWLPTLLIIPAVFVASKYLVPMLDRDGGAGGFYQDGGRIDIWRAALQLADENPWLGGGANSFSLNVYQVMENLGAEPDKVHNEALQLAVDYGYPALVVMVLLIGVPISWSILRFVRGVDSESTVWESVGLIGILVQANFSFVFHVGPGVLLAGIILGRISYGLRSTQDALLNSDGSSLDDDATGYRQFLITTRGFTHEYFSGNVAAASSLINHFSDREDPWFRFRSRILFHIKTGNSVRLDNVVNEIRSKCVSELCALAEVKDEVETHTIFGVMKKFFLLGFAAIVTLIGYHFTHVLKDGWSLSFSRSEPMSVWQRFEKWVSLKENYPYLAVDRRVLTVALDCIYVFETGAAREYWAEASRRRIEDAVSGSVGDPMVALQLACVLGWAGDEEEAMKLYDRAIADQGNNESLFMANACKGQYYYELAQGADQAGQPERMKGYARGAFHSLSDSQSALAATPWRFSRDFAAILDECRKASQP